MEEGGEEYSSELHVCPACESHLIEKNGKKKCRSCGFTMGESTLESSSDWGL